MKSMFAWDDKYSVGHPGIDTQHQQLFRIADTLYNSMMKGQGKTQLAQTLRELLNYTKTHFSFEEQLMKSMSYPNFDAHKREHEGLLKKAADLQHNFENGSSLLTIEVMEFLKNWLSHHIAQSDHGISQYVKTRSAA